MQLTKSNLKKIIPQPGLSVPDEKVMELPEKVLQFGTGILLRGLPDYFIDKANKQGLFNGRVVVVKSTGQGDVKAFEQQDGLYTICIRGWESNREIDEKIINASISRVLSAGDEWDQILKCAYDPSIQLIISNTTEVGIVYSGDDIRESPPPSFPGKLLAFLHQRYKAFGGNAESGMVIVPTELITNNGEKLREIVLQLAETNRLDAGFMDWLKSANHFCNSLVDRIVPGALPPADKKAIEDQLGYTDELMIMAESFRLWAIESGHERVKSVLSFSQADEGMIIAPDIEKFRELKLRLLNGTHSFCCGIALLAGFDTVKQAMNHEQMLGFVRKLMLREMVEAIKGSLISYEEACAFGNKVIDRFSNPFLEHKWMSIAMNYTSKMRMRNIPLLQQYYAKTQEVPEQMALGFAAYIVFMNCRKGEDGNYYRDINGRSCLLNDEAAAYFAGIWSLHDTEKVVDSVLGNTDLWGINLSSIPGFAQVIKENIRLMEKGGVLSVLNNNSTTK